MPSNPLRLNIRPKLVIQYGLVTAGAAAITEALRASGGADVTLREIGAVVSLATLSSLPLGLWAGHRLSRRAHHLLDVSRAWLRGNLALRVDDPHGDELGDLGGQLNLLAEQLGEDEQDLKELHERNARLTDQVRALTVVEERNRLARELHDSVKQHLFSLAMTASALRTHFDRMPHPPAELAEMVYEIESAAQNAQRETTRLIEDLRPGSLQEQGLAKALNDYTLLFGAQEHLLVYLDITGDDAAPPLSPTVAETLYRVAQEALHNVARHAHATRVDVHLHILPERATLSIEDNGIGFDPITAHKGLGMANMQERVMAVGGRLNVKSQVGVGVTVTAEIGLPSALTPQSTAGLLSDSRPSPTYDNWAWLGQKLVIPVGQTWPWLPADMAYLRDPLITPREATLAVRRTEGFLGLGRGYDLQFEQQPTPLARLYRTYAGYKWRSEGARWMLRIIQGLNGRMVLLRNQQSLAALQYQGRQMNTWTEVVYDNHGYQLSYVKENACHFILSNEQNVPLLCAKGTELPQLTLYHPLPLPLLIMTVARILDELATAAPNVAA